MTKPNPSLTRLSDRELLTRVRDAAQQERRVTAALIALLAELDARRLYLGEGCSSLFTYCTQVLHLSEHAAYNRIEAARAARRFPVILDLIESAAVTLTTVRHRAASDEWQSLRRARTRAAQKEARDRVAHRDAQPTAGWSVDRAQAADTCNADNRGRSSATIDGGWYRGANG